MIAAILKKIFPILYYHLKKVVRKERLRQFDHMTLEDMMREDAGLYKKYIGKELDWGNLHTYTEKMQYEKIFGTDPRKTQLTDKYAVRTWVEKKIGAEYLVPLIGTWKRSDDIEFSELPNQFVLKTNNGSGDAVIVRDKSALSPKRIREIKVRLDYCLNCNFSAELYELHYQKIAPLIIAEELLSNGAEDDLPDYKFMCFDGKPVYCWVDKGRYHNHKRNVYDLDWNLQSWNQRDYGNYEGVIDKPERFEDMIEIATKLAEGFPHVRVDLYNLDGKIYFGEMTFTNGSGLEPIFPESMDLALGNMWHIDCELPTF